jgi:glycosyltransferase involved in cell wall biosynthesis
MDSILGQTWDDLEVVVVDDGSTDGSGELLDRYAARDARVRVIHQENRGLGPALDAGCLAACGDLIARQDGDDVSAPTRIARQVEYLRTHPDAVLCGTWTWFVHPVEGPTASWEVPDDPALLRRFLERGSNPLVHGSVMFRRSAYLREGQGYRFRRDCEDYDLWLRLSAFGEVGCLPSVEYLYTVNPDGVSFGYTESRALVSELCLRLHRERRRMGREISDHKAEIQRIYARHEPGVGEEHRRTAAVYARGIDALRAGRWAAFTEHMLEAREGGGPFAMKARVRLALAWAGPLLRILYAVRTRGSAERYFRYLAENTPLPSYAAGPR